MQSSIRPIALAVTLAACFAAGSGVALAESPDHAGIRVTVSDLDLSKPGGVKALYARINTAARRYCDSLYTRTGSRISSGLEGCVVDAVDSTVRSMNLPSLSAFHAERGGFQKKG